MSPGNHLFSLIGLLRLIEFPLPYQSFSQNELVPEGEIWKFRVQLQLFSGTTDKLLRTVEGPHLAYIARLRYKVCAQVLFWLQNLRITS
jgi:hypothetical protein